MNESAWLIESTFQGEVTYWWGGRNGWCAHWVDHVDHAVRFCRKQDAEMAIRLLDEHMAKATEHVWLEVGRKTWELYT